MMLSHRLKLPEIPPAISKQQNYVQQVKAIPLMGAGALGLGMTVTNAAQWRQSKSAEEREDIARSLDHVLNNYPNQ